MATVTPSRDRGQLILVAGLTVAVILVVLVLLLNTVIYTENLATRGVDSGGDDAVAYRATVVGSVEELIERENEHYNKGHSPVEGVKGGIDEIEKYLGERHHHRGAISEVRYNEGNIETGTSIVWQDGSRDFTSAGEEPAATWTIATNATNIERFVVTVESVDLSEETGEEPFRLVMDDWSMEIDVTEDETNEYDEWRVIVERSGGGSTTYNYDYTGERLEIDLVTDTIEVEDQSSPDTVDPSPPEVAEEISYENGDMVTGTFELHADGTPNESDLTEYAGGSGGDPYYTYTVESVDLAIHYETSELRFITEETVAPEEP